MEIQGPGKHTALRALVDPHRLGNTDEYMDALYSQVGCRLPVTRAGFCWAEVGVDRLVLRVKRACASVSDILDSNYGAIVVAQECDVTTVRSSGKV